MSWNYRIVCDTTSRIDHKPDHILAEVYYDKGTGLPRYFTQAFAPVYDPEVDTDGPVETIRWSLVAMLEACAKPILNYPGDFSN